MVIFAGKSDIAVKERTEKTLSAAGIVFESRFCSAHKSPDFLDEIMQGGGWSFFITGAGLAAALPGVVAAKTVRPVIGVPCSGSFEGLDALLSIIQMPPGIPVLAVGIDNGEEAARQGMKFLEQREKVAVIGDGSSKAVGKAVGILEKLGIPFSLSQKLEKDAVNIRFVTLGSSPDHSEDFLTINVPVSDTDKAEDALKLLQLTRKGLWVGVNRGDNAAVAAAEVLSINGRYDAALLAYREELKKGVVDLNAAKA